LGTDANLDRRPAGRRPIWARAVSFRPLGVVACVCVLRSAWRPPPKRPAAHYLAGWRRRQESRRCRRRQTRLILIQRRDLARRESSPQERPAEACVIGRFPRSSATIKRAAGRSDDRGAEARERKSIIEFFGLAPAEGSTAAASRWAPAIGSGRGALVACDGCDAAAAPPRLGETGKCESEIETHELGVPKALPSLRRSRLPVTAAAGERARLPQVGRQGARSSTVASA
jgi:hypothetical protein